MLILKIWNFIKGFVKINVKGIFSERFLNICMHRDIYMWDVKKREQNSIDMNISINGFKSLRPIVKKSKVHIKILEKHGLPFILYKNKKRKIFLIGAVVAIAFIVYMTSFIWVIDVTGNEKVSDDVIINALSKSGFKIGSRRYGVDVASLQNKMLLEIDSLSWLWVDIKGTKATVEVKEKTPIPEIVDKNKPCNIIADRDGVITQVLITDGLKVVHVGDVVKKGDLLASGVVGTLYEGVKYIHSTGSVTARTWYDKEIAVPLKKVDEVKTGKKISKNTVNFFGFDVKLYVRQEPEYKKYKKETTVSRLCIGFDNYLPISVTCDKYYEIQEVAANLSVEQAFEIGKEKLTEEIEKDFADDVEVIARSFDYEKTDGGSIKVTASYECSEDIACEVQIEP